MNLEEIEALKEPGVQKFIAEHINDDPAKLALKYSGDNTFPLREAATQIKLRQKARDKFPSFADKPFIYEPVAFEQSSGEYAAKFKATLMKGDRLIDLTGGLGIDSLYLSDNFSETVYCEIDPLRAKLFEYNKSTLGKDNICIKPGDSIKTLAEYPDGYFSWIYADPSRREEGRRSVDINFLKPDIPGNMELLTAKAENICIKLSPAFDLSEAARIFKNMSKFIVVSVNGENKEALVVIKKAPDPLQLCAVLTDKSGRYSIYKESYNKLPVSLKTSETPLKYFYEADPAVIKSRLAKVTALRYDMQALDKTFSFFTGSKRIEDYPGRSFEVVWAEEYKPQAIKRYLSDNGIAKANITTKDFPLSVEALKKKLKLKDGGEVYLFFYTSQEGVLRLVHCRKDIE